MNDKTNRDTNLQKAANSLHVVGGQLIDNTAWFRKHTKKS